MARINLKSGNILQIPLPKGLGFAYARYTDLSRIDRTIRFPDLIRIYDYKTDSVLYDLEIIRKSDYLLAPKLVAGLPPTLRQGVWKIIELGEILEEDAVIPHFSRSEDWKHIVTPSQLDGDKWYYCIDADSSKKIKSKYDNIKHLSPLSAIGTGFIETQIGMAFLIKENKRVDDYFELKEFFEKMAYSGLNETPLYYQLPKETRDKAIDSQS